MIKRNLDELKGSIFNIDNWPVNHPNNIVLKINSKNKSSRHSKIRNSGSMNDLENTNLEMKKYTREEMRINRLIMQFQEEEIRINKKNKISKTKLKTPSDNKSIIIFNRDKIKKPNLNFKVINIKSLIPINK